MAAIDLNADLGEGDPYDESLLSVVTSCNIACGGHVGDSVSMTATVRAALARRVSIGAHPGYPDAAGFGRQSYFLKGPALRDSITRQLDALTAIAATEGARIAHLKPHGALYADAATDPELARLLATIAGAHSEKLMLVGPPASALAAAAADAGIGFRAEAFVDRAYRADGSLVPRRETGAVHGDLNTITTQATEIAQRARVTCQDGTVIDVPADTLCIHGDTEHADEIALAVRDVLQANGIAVRAYE